MKEKRRKKKKKRTEQPIRRRKEKKKEKKSKVVKSCGWVLFVGPLCVFNYNIAIELWVMETESGWEMVGLVREPHTYDPNAIKVLNTRT